MSQLIGSITLWVGTAADLDVAEGADPNDRRGKENLEPDDCGFSAVVTPDGLLHGLGANSVVAGARSRLYRPHSTSWHE